MVQATWYLSEASKERGSHFIKANSQSKDLILFFSFVPFSGVYLTGCQVSRTSLDIDLKDLKVCDIIIRLDLIICCPAAHRQVWARI